MVVYLSLALLLLFSNYYVSIKHWTGITRIAFVQNILVDLSTLSLKSFLKLCRLSGKYLFSTENIFVCTQRGFAVFCHSIKLSPIESKVFPWQYTQLLVCSRERLWIHCFTNMNTHCVSLSHRDILIIYSKTLSIAILQEIVDWWYALERWYLNYESL